jgi:VWFA-related protein
MTVSASGYGRALNVTINQVELEACPKVRLYITVTDKNDDPQTGITQNDFSLFENDALQDIIGFTNKMTSPLSVALALDYSSSTIPATLDIEAAAKNFIDLLDTVNNDEAAIIKFDRDIFLTQVFTTSKDDLKAALDEPFPDDRFGTSIFDAVWQAIDATAAAQNKRLAVIVLSDGEDNNSARSLSEVIDYALEKGVPVFTIGLATVNAAVLQQLADETGGQYFFSPTSADLQDIYVQIAEILANQYVLEYISSLFGGLSTILDVEVDFNALQGEDSKVVTGCP